MSEHKEKKRWFASHAKSSAMVISLAIHGILLLIAISFVAVTVITKEDKNFEYKKVERPKKPLKKLKVPVKVNKKKPKPKLRKRIVVKDVKRNIPEFKMPEITGVKGGLASMGDGDGIGSGIGFTMPEIDFFGAKAKGEKVVFVVHFGPATISAQGADNYTPFSRMTGLTIRNRLEDMIQDLPEYTLFNVVAYWAVDTWAMSPEMMLATPENKKKVVDWMEPVNPLEGKYSHCFANKPRSVDQARNQYPKRVDNLPFYAPKWVYPYEVPNAIANKYLGAGKNFVHWNRAVAWAILEQKPDTIFVLTTNYIDAWGGGNKGNPGRLSNAFQRMFVDIYGRDDKQWPTINIVVLAKAGRDATGANNVMNDQFGPIWRDTDADASVIDDITDYMNEEEEDLYRQYRSQYGN